MPDIIQLTNQSWRCYKTLGHLFTFEITIRPKHELITHGPYAHVRHPSYTGVYLTLIGSTCVLLAPGTWTAEHGIHTPVGATLLCLWLLKCAFAFRGTAVRMRAEDKLLHATFKEGWENYAKRVPYKLVPSVYWSYELFHVLKSIITQENCANPVFGQEYTVWKGLWMSGLVY